MRKYLDIPLTLIVTVTLTVAMLWPLDQPPPAPDGSDKLVHLVAFAALSFPLSRTGRFGLLPVFVGASVFGGVIELIQTSFNRTADINVWIADILGGVFRARHRQSHRFRLLPDLSPTAARVLHSRQRCGALRLLRQYRPKPCTRCRSRG